MNKDDWKLAFTSSLSTFVALAMAIAFYFFISRLPQIQSTFHWIGEILSPFVYGGVMAYLLKTPCNYFEKIFEKKLPGKLKKRAGALSVTLVVLFSVSLIWLLLATVLPELLDSIIQIFVDLPKQISRFTTWLSSKLDSDDAFIQYLNDTVQDFGNSLNQWYQNDFGPMVEQMIGGFASTITSIVNGMYNVFVGIIVCVYALSSRKTFARQGRKIIYAVFKQPHAKQIERELYFADRTFTGFFIGKIIDSTIIGLITYVFCLCMRFTTNNFTNIILISVIIGVTNIIPYFGPFIGAIPCLIIIYISNPINCLIFGIFIIILQQIDGNIIGPKLLANSVGLSAFWVLFSITLFGGLFGFAGILAGVPAFAVIYDMVRRLVNRQLRRKESVLAKSENEINTTADTDKAKKTEKAENTGKTKNVGQKKK